MTEATAPIDDLEDGEIESDGEETAAVPPEVQCEDAGPVTEHMKPENQEIFYSKSGKKKKSKSKGDQKSKDKSKKTRKYINPAEDDFAGNIEKAIRKAMNKLEGGDSYSLEDNEERRKHKKRKKHDSKDVTGKKRKKQGYNEEMDESELMCVRGASPTQTQDEMYPGDDRDSYGSDSSNDSRGIQQNRPQRQRQQQRDKNKNANKNDRRRGGGGAHPMQDPDGVCLYFMQGKCHKGDDCMFSHDALPPRKMELCKFYLMNCCAKRDKCLYMHADFPCKYYHTGLPCIFKDECKFAHGEPLTDNLKNILLKHIESAPKEILGDFPRLNREGAMKMIQQTQAKLMMQFGGNMESQDKAIPSLFELNIPNPQANDSVHFNQFNNDKQNKISPKVRQSRWQNDINISNPNFSLSPNTNAGSANVLNIKNLSGVLTPRQISDLTKMGIENLDQLSQLTVMQLNSIGISIKQITDIQLNTMSIQKLGLINEHPIQPGIPTTAISKDLDLRVPPGAVFNTAITSTISNDLLGKDVDMRFQPPVVVPRTEEATANVKRESQLNKDSIDIDQYTKDAMKFATKDKENIDISNETFDNDKSLISNETKDVDHRVLPFQEDTIKTLPEEIYTNKESDTDIRFLQPESVFKRSPGKRHRRSTTTDDEDNHLLIDEKCYSSDEEKISRRKSLSSSPIPASVSPPAPPQVIEPSAVINKIGDISKILITEEVTKLLNSMKNNLQDFKTEPSSDIHESPKLKDPRSKRSPEKQIESIKPVNKKPARISIYECIDGEPTDGRRRSDVDLRKNDFPSFGDTDLRPGTSGDIDLRLGLPFKAIPNYTPASEIDGSINSHPPMPYKVLPIHIPRPDYTDIRNSTAKSQALVDPRLRKVFRLSIEESGGSDNEKPSKPATPPGPRIDPRRKQSNENEQKVNSLDIQTVLQNSNWFKDLSSTQKIFVNQNLMPVTQMLKQFHQDKTPGRVLDISAIQNNPVLCGILNNLGVTLGDTGEYSYLPKPTKEALLKTPVNFNQPGNPFAMNVNMPNPAIMDPNNMNMMNIPPIAMGAMGNMNAGPNIHGFNQPMPDPRGGPAPGLLGIAPNIPHNFTGNYGGPNNFGNMNFNGPNSGNDFNSYMDGEQNYPRFPNRGGNHRGRGNDRWNRGGRGHRDRKNFNDRGNWKNDRH